MFDQHKLFDGVKISEQGLDKSTRTMAHELVHTMGVSHDGQEGNYDCVGEYQRPRRGPKYVQSLELKKSLNFFDKVLVASWVPCIFLEPQNGQPAVKGFYSAFEVFNII